MPYPKHIFSCGCEIYKPEYGIKRDRHGLKTPRCDKHDDAELVGKLQECVCGCHKVLRTSKMCNSGAIHPDCRRKRQKMYRQTKKGRHVATEKQASGVGREMLL